MREPKHNNNPWTDDEIEVYCQSTKEILSKIHERCSQNKVKSKENKEKAEELVTCNQQD